MVCFVKSSSGSRLEDSLGDCWDIFEEKEADRDTLLGKVACRWMGECEA